MSDVQRILDALVALTKALPGAGGAHLTIGIHGCDDAGVSAFAAIGARTDIYQSDDRTHEWTAASLTVNGVSIAAYSPHREIVKSDPVAVEAALAQAAEALS